MISSFCTRSVKFLNLKHFVIGLWGADWNAVSSSSLPETLVQLHTMIAWFCFIWKIVQGHICNFTIKYFLIIGTGHQWLSNFVQMFGFCWVCMCCVFVNRLGRASYSKSCLLFSRLTLLILMRVLWYSSKVHPNLKLRKNWKNSSIGLWGSDVKLMI